MSVPSRSPSKASAPNPEQFVGVSVPTPPITDDDGSASADLVSALAALASGSGTGESVMAALARSRLLVPVVAMLDEHEVGPSGHRVEKHSSMAIVLVEAEDGRRTLLAFSGTDSLNRWRADARPVSLMAPLAARAALTERADSLLVDVAGPTAFAVTGRELVKLAAVARSSGAPDQDPVVRAALAERLRAHDWPTAASLTAADVGDSATVHVEGVAATEQVVALVRDLAGDAALRWLLPHGIRVRQVQPGTLADTPSRCFP